MTLASGFRLGAAACRLHPVIVVAMALMQPGLPTAQPAATPSFDVASVKPNRSGDRESASFVQPGGRYTATNVTLRMLVKSAYGLHDTQLVGGPSWINTERFDVAAKAEGYPTAAGFRDQARLMLRPLLAERFKLVVKPERRDLPVYALVVARPDGGFGPQFRRFESGDCDGPPKAMRIAPGGSEPEAPLPCGAEIYRLGHLAARGMPVSVFVLNISRWTDRVVIDGTGLEGRFDWEVQWVPDDLTSDRTIAPEGPSLFAAVRDQAGFRIDRRRSSVEVLVVERAERPDPD